MSCAFQLLETSASTYSKSIPDKLHAQYYLLHWFWQYPNTISFISTWGHHQSYWTIHNDYNGMVLLTYWHILNIQHWHIQELDYHQCGAVGDRLGNQPVFLHIPPWSYSTCLFSSLYSCDTHSDLLVFVYCGFTWGSGSLLHMARVLVPVGRLLMLILNGHFNCQILHSETTNINYDNMNI